MKVFELIGLLEKCDKNKDVLIACDDVAVNEDIYVSEDAILFSDGSEKTDHVLISNYDQGEI